MKTQRTTLALIVAGFVAALVALANVGTATHLDGLVGFGAVAVLVAVAALDYGFGRRRLLTK